MSANHFTLTCIGSDAAALTSLHSQLQAAMTADFDAWPAPLRSLFEEWNRPSVISASLRGETLRCVIETSAHDELEQEQLKALHAAGAEYIRARIWYDQVGETETLHYKAGKRIATKAFPKPTLSEPERLYELVLESKDSALVKEIKAGADANCAVDGVPLFVHVLRAGLAKSVRAMFDAKVDLAACLPWAAEVVGKIETYGGAKAEAMLRGLFGAPGADSRALWSSAGVLRTVCAHPKLLQWLMAQDGIDVNAMLYTDDEPREEMGSLLFNSVEFFEDEPSVLDPLQARGARAIAPAKMSDAWRLDRTFCNYRNAETPTQLAAAGIDLETAIWNGFTLLRCAMRNAHSGRHYMPMVVELLELDASVAFWIEPKAFQREVLVKLLGASEREALRLYSEGPPEDAFDLGRDGHLIVDIFRCLLERGLNPNMGVSIEVKGMANREDYSSARVPSIRYRGAWLDAVASLLCGRGTDLRPLCLPLVELLLRHGASPHSAGERITGPWQSGFDEIETLGDWSQLEAQFLDSGTVLERLQHRQALEPDEIDAAVISALLARA